MIRQVNYRMAPNRMDRESNKIANKKKILMKFAADRVSPIPHFSSTTAFPG